MSNNERPLISVIVPVYNVERYFRRFVDSVRGQTYNEFEVILWDDGSTDSSLQLCENATADDARFRTFHSSNHGVAAARRNSLRVAKGRYITFIDPDDWVDNDYLKTLVSALINTGSDVSVSNTVTSSKPTTLHKEIEVIPPEEAICRLSNRFYPGIEQRIRGELWAKMFDMTKLKALNIKDMKTCSDTPTVIDAIKEAQRIAIIPATLYHYLEDRPDSLQTTKALGTLRDLWSVHEHLASTVTNNFSGLDQYIYRDAISTLTIILGRILKTSVDVIEENELRRQYAYFLRILCEQGFHRALPLTAYIKILVFRGGYDFAAIFVHAHTRLRN
jgi:glycosyltransferase involved in cell wall biosynthesis